MATLGFAIFDTAIGYCGIAWGARALTGVQLPEADEDRTRERMRRRFPLCSEMEPPPQVMDAMLDIRALLSGEPHHPVDLSNIELDMDAVPPFHRRVYDVARSIPPGDTLTYGDIATRLGDSGSARAVGQALGHNPFAPVVPCHRVLGAGGRSGGFSASGGVATKLRLLRIERARFNGPGLFDELPRAE